MTDVPRLVHVTSARVVGDHELRLTFEDGTVVLDDDAAPHAASGVPWRFRALPLEASRSAECAPQVLDEHHQMQRVGGRPDETESLIERGGWLVARVHEHGAGADDVSRLERPHGGVRHQRPPVPLGLAGAVDSEASEQDDPDGVRGHPAGVPLGKLPPLH